MCEGVEFGLDVCFINFRQCRKLSEVDPKGVKQRLVSLREMIDNKGQIVVTMTSQTSQVKQVFQYTYSLGSIMMFGNNLSVLGVLWSVL